MAKQKNQSEESNVATLDAPEESAAVRMGDIVIYCGRAMESPCPAIVTSDPRDDGKLNLTAFPAGQVPTPLWGVEEDAGGKPFTWRRR